MNIQVTNDGFGLLRALGPDIGSFIGVTIFIIVGWLSFRYIAGKDEQARRVGWKAALVIWLLVIVALVANTASKSVSLRIPRSDTNATGVYLDMDRAIEGKPQR